MGFVTFQVSGPRANREALYLAPQRVSWEQSIRSYLDRSTAYEARWQRQAAEHLGPYGFRNII